MLLYGQYILLIGTNMTKFNLKVKPIFGKETNNASKKTTGLSLIRIYIKKLFKFTWLATLLAIVFILVVNFSADYIGTTDADYKKVNLFRAQLTSINNTDAKILAQKEHLLNLIDTSLADGKLTISEASSIEIRYALFENNYPDIFKE